jgi:hypothetical protein
MDRVALHSMTSRRVNTAVCIGPFASNRAARCLSDD